MLRFLLPLFACLLFSLSAFAQQAPPEMLDLLSKYKQITSGKIVFTQTTSSSFVTDSSSKRVELCFRKNERKTKSYKGYDVYFHIVGKGYQNSSLLCGDSIYYYSDSILYTKSHISSQDKEDIKDQVRELPVMESLLFFATMSGDKLSLKDETKDYWIMKGKEYQLCIRKEDSLITRIEFDYHDKIGDFYKRIDIIEQEYGLVFPQKIFPFNPDSLSNNLTRYKRDENRQRADSLIGQKAPNFTLPNLDGDSISLSDFHGKYVLLDFWYIGCGPCVFALPEIQKLSEELDPEKVKIIGIEVYHMDPEKVRKFMAEKGAFYETLLAKKQEEIASSFCVESYPTFFIINPDGVIEQLHLGYSPGRMKKLTKELKKLTE